MRALVLTLDSLERGIIAVLAGAALILACNAMVSRYLLPGLALDWTFEVITFLVIWGVFLAAARLVTVGGHIRIDIVLVRLGSAARRRMELFAAVLALAVAVLLLVSGALVVSEAVRWGETTSSTLRIPLWIYYLSLPVGAALMALRLAARIAGLATGTVHDSVAGQEAT